MERFIIKDIKYDYRPIRLYYSDIEEVVDNEKIFDLENIKKMLNDLKNEK